MVTQLLQTCPRENLGLNGPLLQPQHQPAREEELPLQTDYPPGPPALEVPPAPGQWVLYSVYCTYILKKEKKIRIFLYMIQEF